MSFYDSKKLGINNRYKANKMNYILRYSDLRKKLDIAPKIKCTIFISIFNYAQLILL